MPENENQKPPKVFISYSHDTPAHKQWVAEFASKLVKNGVDVIFDQWDLGLGDDIPKFMERGVSESDRVLMICTDQYVKKADDGKGGVGYEAMIVTGELVRDLGTSKFIPVVRQAKGSALLPRSVSTRFYINLSEEQNYDEQFESLLRELHEVPANRKPPLGKNPFAQQPSGTETPPALSKSGLTIDITEILSDIPSIYHAALDVARQGDLLVWRKIIRQATNPIQEQLKQWRQKYDAQPPKDIKNLNAATLEGISIYAPLFSIALAGVESGRDKFLNQIGFIDEIINPRGWNWAGYTVYSNLPYTIAYIYQALHGGICMQTGQFLQVIKFARSRITLNDNKSYPINKCHNIVGWPDTLGGNSRTGWQFLMNLPEQWKWLEELYGTRDEYREAICAYYIAMNIIEFADTIAENKEDMLKDAQAKRIQIDLDLPLEFMREDKNIVRKGYRLLLTEPEKVRMIWQSKKIPDAKMKELWPVWIFHLKLWLSSQGFFMGMFQIVHENIFDELEQ